MKLLTRRSALKVIGAGLVTGACAPGDAGLEEDAGAATGAGDDAGRADGSSGGDAGAHDAGRGDDAGASPHEDAGAEPRDDAGVDAGPPPSAEELLSTVDTIVVLMMENRSFDHFFGALRSDPTYAMANVVEGLRGTESNLSPAGVAVPVYKLDNYTPADPPHSWDAVHAQWNEGRNDGFVTQHAGDSENEVMGFHDRSQIPFYYWLADNFTVCDRWFSSLLGPTWPNRYYLHAATSNGKKDNSPGNEPDATVWSRLKDEGLTFKNYFDGLVPWYLGGFLGKLLTLNPTVGLSQFFTDAQNGTLPSFSIIDPDFQANDDHPSHDIMRGQAFVASIYKALAESPQWDRLLFVITYDEHGGFYDHVPPPAVDDERPEFRQLGFRVPAIVVGPTVRRGYVHTQTLEHSSVAATLRTRFGIESLSRRMDAANDLAGCIDPATYRDPQPPPPGMPAVAMSLTRALTNGVGENSQPQLDAMIASGAIPAHLVDRRPASERIRAWLAHGERLGAVRLTP